MKKALIIFFLLIAFKAQAIEGDDIFEKYNSWEMPIPASPVITANSLNFITDLANNSTRWGVAYKDWSYPIWQADASTPNVTVAMANPAGTCGSNAIFHGWNIVPIPEGAWSAGMTEHCAGAYRDGHMAVLSADGKWVWDFFRAKNCGSGWTASCIRKRARTLEAANEEVNVWDGSGIINTIDNLGSVRACSASALLQGTITYDDYLSGSIDHAIAFGYYGINDDLHWAKYPCREYRGGIKDAPYAMIEGMRVQLNPSHDCAQYANPMTHMICEALKKYGAILVDSTGCCGSNALYAEGIEGKLNFWNNILEDPLPIPISSANFRLVEPVCDNSLYCPNLAEEQSDTTPPAAPTGVSVN